MNLDDIKYLRLSCYCGDELESDKESTDNQLIYHCIGCGLRFTVERMQSGNF